MVIKKEKADIYNGVFDFIWGVQKSHKNKPFQKQGEDFSGYTSSLIEVGTQPLIFPLEQTFSLIDEAIDGATNVKLGNASKYGLSDMGKVSLDPKKWMTPSTLGVIKPKDKWVGIGGGLHYNVDAALISLYTFNNGASAQDAYKAGQLFGDIIKEQIIEEESGKFEFSKSNPNFSSLANSIFSSKTFEEVDSYRRDNIFMQDGIDLVVSSIVKTNRSLTKRDLNKLISDLQKETSKEMRIQKTSNFLQSKGLSVERSGTLSNTLWSGDSDTSFGMYRVDENDVRTMINDRLSNNYKIDPKTIIEIEKQILRHGVVNDKFLNEIIQDKVGQNIFAKDRITKLLQDRINNKEKFVENRKDSNILHSTIKTEKNVTIPHQFDKDTTNTVLVNVNQQDDLSKTSVKHVVSNLQTRSTVQQVGDSIAQTDGAIQPVMENAMVNIVTQNSVTTQSEEPMLQNDKIFTKPTLDNLIRQRNVENLTQGYADQNQIQTNIGRVDLENIDKHYFTDEDKVLLQLIKDTGVGISEAQFKELLSSIDNLENSQDVDNFVGMYFKRYNIITDKEQGKIDASNLAKIKVNNGKDIALKAILIANATEYFYKQGNLNPTMLDIQNRIQATRFMVNPSRTDSLGSKLERNLLRYRWLKESGTWGATLLSGKWEDFGKDVNFAKIVEEVEVKGADNRVIGTYFKPSNTVAGRLLGKAYYLHPRNLLRGLFVDGSLLLKWSCDKDNKVDPTKVPYLLRQFTLNKALAPIKKIFQNITSKLYDFVAPAFVGMKRIVTNLLRRVLGMTGVSGFIASKLIEIFSEQISQIVNKIVVFFMYTAVSLLLMLVLSLGGGGSNREIESYLHRQALQEEVNGVVGDTFVDTDFLLKE